MSQFITHICPHHTPFQPLPFPAEPKQFVSFISYLFEARYAPSTIVNTVSAVAFANKLFQGEDPRKHFLVNKMLEGSKRLGHSPDPRQPITLNILHKLLSSVPTITSSNHFCTLYSAMLLIAFHALLRVGEFTVRSNSSQGPHTIQTSNCSVIFRADVPHALQITIESFKHSKGRPFTLFISPFTNSTPPNLS